MVVSAPVGFELLGCFNVSATFEREGQRIGQPKNHVAVVSIPRSRVPAGGGPISLSSPSPGSGDSIEDAVDGATVDDGGGTAMALLFVAKAGFTNAVAAAGTAFAINDMGRFRMKFIHEGPGGNTLVLCSVSNGQLPQDVRRLAQFISDIKIGKAPGMPHKCIACGLKDKAEVDKKRKQEEAVKEREVKRQRMEEEKKVKDEQKKREKEEREARQKQERAMKELHKKLKEVEKDRDDMDRIRESLGKELKERGDIIRDLQEKLKEKAAAAAKEAEKRREEESRRAREESAARDAAWRMKEAEIRRAMEEEFRVKREEEQRVRHAADMQRWAREQQKAKEAEELRRKLQEEEGKRMFEAMSHREEMAKMKADVERMQQHYQQQYQQGQNQQQDGFGPPPPPPPKDAPAEVLSRYSTLLRERETRMRAAFAAAAAEIRRAEGELRKKRTEEERRRKAEEARRGKAESARQKREEAMNAERMREEEERKRAQAEEMRKREEERKRMEEAEKARRAQEEVRRKAMAEESALAAKQKWLEDQYRMRQAGEGEGGGGGREGKGGRQVRVRGEKPEEKREREVRARRPHGASSHTCVVPPPHSTTPMTYEQYENRLRQIKNSAGSANVPLHFWDIPWPPEGNCLFLSPTDEPGLKKRKFKDALLFWHADKFVAFCGSRLVEDHKEVILKKVARLSQEVVEARNNL
ncbi:unnamed protein product [Closterium sp. Naga37s-1]|nr:unnamed protein product [Closterium sp. Naga37s-1]